MTRPSESGFFARFIPNWETLTLNTCVQENQIFISLIRTFQNLECKNTICHDTV